MTYLVLARKYRPSTFAEVVGQDHVTRTLGNAFATGRVHHAFLFCGPRGCGKTTLARIVGKALNCLAEGRTGAEPCGQCASCASINNGSAVDYQEMDGASNRGIDAIRELTEAVRYQPAVLRKKVYVIDEVHMLTTEAFNALLKTLEEPPPHVTFVLATTEPHKVPNTILSRCQRYDFKLVPAVRLGQHLTAIFAKEQIAIEPGAISLVVRESGGSVRDALSLCDQLISYVGNAALTERDVAEVLGVADRALTRALVRALAGGDAGGALSAVESAIERGVDEVQLARAIVRYLRDLSVLQVAGAALHRSLVDATEEEVAELAAEAGALDRSRITQMFERMLRCCDELGKTLQPRLVLDCALIDVATIEPLVPLGDLLERLTELEARLAGKPVRPGGGGGTKERPRAPTAPGPGAPSASGSRPVPPVRTAPTASASTGAPAAVSAERAAPTSATSVASPSAGGASAAASTAPASHAFASSGAPLIAGGVAAASSGGASPSAGGASVTARIPEASSGTSGTPATSGTSATSDGAPSASSAASSGGEVAAPAPSTVSSPVSMQPSGPVPRPETVASGSGPHDHAAREGAPAKFTIPVDAAAALTAWNQVLAELEAMGKVSLFMPFQHARVLRWTAELLELGFPVETHSMGEMAKDSVEELRAIVRGLGPALASIRIAVRLLDAGESKTSVARSVLETTRERTSAERNRREVEAREHPITKHVLQTFGAQIKEIKTDV
jgi:DNA polymerase-3 subunit gamma/tau